MQVAPDRSRIGVSRDAARPWVLESLEAAPGSLHRVASQSQCGEKHQTAGGRISVARNVMVIAPTAIAVLTPQQRFDGPVDRGAVHARANELGADESGGPVARLTGQGLKVTPQTVAALLGQQELDTVGQGLLDGCGADARHTASSPDRRTGSG